jgi:hypothetical protein
MIRHLALPRAARTLLLSCALGAPVAATASAAQPGDTRSGSVEVVVTYTGAGQWTRGAERTAVTYARKLTYRMPLIGHYAPASGWKELDARLPPAIEGDIPEQKATAADMASISVSLEAAADACGEDEMCFARMMRGDVTRLQRGGKIVVPATMPKINAPDFTRFLVLAPSDCGAATVTVQDRYKGVRIEGGEGDAGLRPYAYTETAAETHRGEVPSSQHCRFAAVIDTAAGSLSLFVPIEAKASTTRSDVKDTAYDRYVSNTNGRVRLAARTRWLDIKPAGGKVMSGRQVIENVNDADPATAAALRAVVEWRITLD